MVYRGGQQKGINDDVKKTNKMTAISKKGGKKNKKEMYKKNGKKESTNAANRLKDNTTKDSVSQQRRVNKEKAIRKHDPNWEDRRRLNRLYSNLINNTTSTNTTNAAAAHHDDVNDNKKSDIVEDILKEMMTKGINNYILNHSGSRIVQACMKYGTMDQRKRILTTLSGEGLEDAILQGKAYGMLAIERLISYGIKTDKKLTINTILKPLLGDRKIVERLFIHRVGCRFLSTMYNNTKIPSQYRRRIYTIISTPAVYDIKAMTNDDDGGVDVDNMDNNKLLDHRMKLCRKAVDKELLDNGSLVHKLFLSTLEISDVIGNTNDIIKELLQLTNEGATRLLSSREGVLVFCRMFGYASAKEKKVLIKECKGNFKALAMNPVDAIVLIRMLQCTDDTVLLSKSILQELLTTTTMEDEEDGNNNIEGMMVDQYGHLVLLYALGERRDRFYPHYYRHIMELPRPSSVKDDELRRKEIRNKVMNTMKKTVMNMDIGKLYELIINRYSSVVLLYLVCSCGSSSSIDDNDTTTIIAKIIKSILVHDNNGDISGQIVSFILVLILKSNSSLVTNTTCSTLKIEYLNNMKITQLCKSRWAFILKAMLNVLSRMDRRWIIDKVEEEGGIDAINTSIKQQQHEDGSNKAGQAFLDTLITVMNEKDTDEEEEEEEVNDGMEEEEDDEEEEVGLANDDE